MSNKCPKCDAENTQDSQFCKKCATSLPIDKSQPSFTKTLETPVSELTRGTLFADRYEIIEELGSGGMGQVYRVEDTKTNEEIALKLIRAEIAADKKTIDRFRNELTTARKIRHKNVCGMYDLGEYKGIHFITMEFVPGQDLKGLIRQSGQLAVGTTINIAKQICDGLTEAHKSGVVHRDLKPSNIMIDKEGDVRIMDFGIARSLEAKGITGAGVMIGTPEYMSPEQVEGKEVDQQSDIYSLGVILYEMITGRVPFEGDTPFTIGMKHKGEMPKNPKELNTQISDDLNLLLLRCLEKEKEQRYQSAGELRSELSNIERGIPSTEKVIPKRKPLTSKEITVTFGLKKLLVPGLVFIAVIIIGLILWKILPSKKTAQLAPSGKPSLAVMYFENNTGDENLDHWRKGISDLLITDLTQSKYLKVLGGDRLFNILSQMDQLEAKSYSSEVLKQVATRGGVNHIARGSYSKAGDILRIDIVLQDAHSGEPIATQKVERKGEDGVFSMVDELTKWIKTSFNFSKEMIRGDLDSLIEKTTTSSPEAYKYFSEGFRYNWKGDYHRSIQLLERAVAIDPEFAIAYMVLAEAWGHLGYSSERKQFHQKAFDLSDRVSEGERYRIQGYYYLGSGEKTYDKAIEAFNRLIQLYPDDLNGNRSLGYVLIAVEQWDKALELFNMNIRNKIENFLPYSSAATVYEAKGMYEEAKDILELYKNNFSDIAGVHWELSYIHLCQGQYEAAFNEADKAYLLNPESYITPVFKGSIYYLSGDLSEAENEYHKLLDFKEQIAHIRGRERLHDLYLLGGRFQDSINQVKQGFDLAERQDEKGRKSYFCRILGHLYLKSANFEKALIECENAMNFSSEAGSVTQEIKALHLKGLINLKKNSPKEALNVADELKATIDGWINEKLARYYFHLMGMISLEQENFSDAIEYFQKGISLLSYQYSYDDTHAIYLDPLGLAYYKMRDLEKAKDQYEKITKLTTGRIHYGDIYAKSFYMLGKIYEQQGETAKAIEHYEKFLELWKDADPGIPEVEDARKRLAGLQKLP